MAVAAVGKVALTGLHDGLGPPDLPKVPDGGPIGPLKLWFATGVELRRFHCSSSSVREWLVRLRANDNNRQARK